MVDDKGDIHQHSSWGLTFYVGDKQSHLLSDALEKSSVKKVHLATKEGFTWECFSFFPLGFLFQKQPHRERKAVPKWWFVYWVSWLEACGWTGGVVVCRLMSPASPFVIDMNYTGSHAHLITHQKYCGSG